MTSFRFVKNISMGVLLLVSAVCMAQSDPNAMTMGQAQSMSWEDCAAPLVSLRTWLSNPVVGPPGYRGQVPRFTNEQCLRELLPNHGENNASFTALLNAARALQPVEAVADPSATPVVTTARATASQVQEAHRTLVTALGNSSAPAGGSAVYCRLHRNSDAMAAMNGTTSASDGWNFEVVDSQRAVRNVNDLLMIRLRTALSDYQAGGCAQIVSNEVRASGATASRTRRGGVNRAGASARQ